MSTATLDEDLFFSFEIGWIASIDPYATFGLDPAASPDDVRERLKAGIPEGAVASASAGILSVPARRLAWHLLERPLQAPRVRDFAAALWNPAKHRLTASHLLHEALAAEASESRGAPSVDEWEIVLDSWTRFARNGRAAPYLASVARALALPEPEETAGAVLSAIEEQLFPGLHAILAMTSKCPKVQSYHRERLDNPGTASLPVRIARLALRDEQFAAARRLRADGHHLLALHGYMRMKPAGGVERGLLSVEIGDLVDEMARRTQSCELTEAMSLCSALERAIETLPFDPRPFAALFSLHLRCGIQLITDQRRFNEAGLHLAKAAVMQPTNEQARRLFAQARQALRDAAAELDHLQRMGRTLNERGWSLYSEVRKDMKNASAFAGSAAAQHLCALHEESLGASFALRLGLDPSSEAARRAAWFLVATLLEGKTGARSFTEVRAQIVDAHPMLDSAPWPALRSAFEKAEACSIEDMLTALPPPPLQKTVEARTFLEMTAAGLRTQITQPNRRPERLQSSLVSAWLFSSLDRRAKLMAAVGIACLAAVGTLRAGVAWDGWRRAVAYGELRAAAAAKRPAAMLEASRSFFAHAPKGSGDPRIAEVARTYEDALWREMSRATQEKKDGELQDLLADARALAAREERGQ